MFVLKYISTGLCLTSFVELQKKNTKPSIYLVKGIQNIHVERTLVVGILCLGPLLGGWVEVVFTPESEHKEKLLQLNAMANRKVVAITCS